MPITPSDTGTQFVKLASGDWAVAVANVRGDGTVVDPTAPAAGPTSLTKAEDAAHASGDVGVMLLGVSNQAQTNFAADGDYVPLGLTTKGYMIVNPMLGETNVDGASVAFAGMADNTGTARGVLVGNWLFNNSLYDRQRNNIDQTVGITAAGATTTQTGADQTNYNHRGIKVVLDMTVVGTGSVTLAIQGKDLASGKYYTILSGAAVVTNVTNVYTVYPGITAAANVSVSDILPRTFRIVCTANNANATTYTVSASLIL